MQSSSLLRTTWGGSHGGVPPFDEVKPEEFIQAFEIAIANATTEMDAIANAPVTENGLTFGNTIEVMELAGQQLNKLSALFGVHCHNLNHGAVPEAQRTVGPLLAAFQDKVIQNQALFARIKAVNDTKATAGLQEDQLRLLKEKFEEFSRNGAMLNDDDKKKLTVINMRLASLFTTFSQNILEEEDDHVAHEGASRRPAAELRRGVGVGGEGERPRGPVRRAQHPIQRGAFPHLRRQSTCARGCLHRIHPPLGKRQRIQQLRYHPRDPQASRGASAVAWLR